MMSTRRSYFITGVLLSALVVFGATAAQAQVTAPQSATAAPSGFDAIVVTFAPPTNTENISEYQVGHAMKPAIGDVTAANFDVLSPTKVSLGTTTTAYAITGLTAGTDYVVGVRSRDPDAEEEDDQMSDWVMATPNPVKTLALGTIPKVNDLRLDPGDGMIEAQWDAVSDPSGIGIHHYKVMVTAAGGFSLSMGTGSDDNEYTIMNLTNGTEYTVQVRAIGQNQDGSADMNGDGTPERPGDWSNKKKATPMAGDDEDMDDEDMEDEDMDDEDMEETPALPLVGILALFAGLLGAARARLRR